MVLMILILATLFYVMFIISFFALTLLEKEKVKFFGFTSVLCLFGTWVSYYFLNNMYDFHRFTINEIQNRYDYQFINFMQYAYIGMFVFANIIYIICLILYLKKRKKQKVEQMKMVDNI